MDKLHCTIAAMSCISSWACRFFCRSSKIASDVCSSICFFPDRITKWCCEIRWVLRQFLCSFSQASPPPSPILQFLSRWSIAIPMLRFCCVTCPIPPVTYISEIHLLALPIVWCLPALRVVGEFRFLVDISKCSGYLVGMLTHVPPFQMMMITFATTKIAKG